MSYYKEKIKSILSHIPGVRNIINMSLDIEYLYMKIGKLNESLSSLARDYVTRDIERLRSRYKKIKSGLDDVSGGLEDKENLPEYSEEQSILNSFHGLVSIIILNRNGLRKLKILMNSFHDHDFYDNFEIIFIDNASDDDSVAYMETWKNEFRIKIIQNQTNMSFSAGNNLGARESAGEYLLFLNNDTEVTDGWLDELIICMEKAETPGALGAKLIYPVIPEGTVNFGKSYRVQHKGIAFLPTVWNNSFLYGPYNMENGKFDDNTEPDIIERAGVTAAVLMIKRSTFEQIEGFDENYFYGYEDVDLGLKLIKAGYRNYYCPNCLLFHYEYGTQQTNSKREISERELKNLSYYREKWQDFLGEKIFEDKLFGRRVFSESPLKIAMVMSKNSPFTNDSNARLVTRFVNGLEYQDYVIKRIAPEDGRDALDIGIDVDILLSFEKRYDISKITNTNPNLRKIAFVCDNEEKWIGKKFFEKFDHIFVPEGSKNNMSSDRMKKVILLQNDLSSDSLASEFKKSLQSNRISG